MRMTTLGIAHRRRLADPPWVAPTYAEAPTTVDVRAMEPGDWQRVREIFELGIRTGVATLESEPPSWVEWDAVHIPGQRLVACADGNVCGWAALAYAHRTVEHGVAESSVYVHQQ